jgi:hypothetical protein
MKKGISQKQKHDEKRKELPDKKHPKEESDKKHHNLPKTLPNVALEKAKEEEKHVSIESKKSYKKELKDNWSKYANEDDMGMESAAKDLEDFSTYLKESCMLFLIMLFLILFVFSYSNTIKIHLNR